MEQTTSSLPKATLANNPKNIVEAALAAATVDRYIWSGRDALRLTWPVSFNQRCTIRVQLRQPPTRIFSDSPRLLVAGGQEFTTIAPYEVSDGAYLLRLMSPLEISPSEKPSATGQSMPAVHRDIPVYMARGQFTASTDASAEERIIDAIAWVTQQVDQLVPQILKMALGRWSRVRWELIEAARERIERAAPEHLADLVALAGAVCRFGTSTDFQVDMRTQLTATLCRISYDVETAQGSRPDQWTEGDEICLLTAELLAGQLCPITEFTGDQEKGNQQTGQWHQQRASGQIRTWIQRRGRRGFVDWYDSESFEKILVALTHIVDLAEEDDLRELAGVLLDKLFFMLALHNFHGICGAPQRRTAVPQLFGPRFDPLAGITKLLWGQGVWNIHLAGVVSLLCLTGYVVPALLQEIATSDEVGWFYERHFDASGISAPEITTCRTAHYQLSSVQNYRAGEAGQAELVWQASLTADAIVFTSHPGHTNLDNGLDNDLQPNFWCGNCTLPAVAQWQNLLIALYDLAEDDPAGYVHAYFPAFAFDEYVITKQWAFARCGDAFLALFATRGLEWITTGDAAYRELRAYGRGNGWLCYLDQARPGYSFEDFKTKLAQTTVSFIDSTLSCTLPNGTTVAFGPQQPLVVDGVTAPIAGDLHFDTPFVQAEVDADQMTITRGDYALRLDFSDS